MIRCVTCTRNDNMGGMVCGMIYGTMYEMVYFMIRYRCRMVHYVV